MTNSTQKHQLDTLPSDNKMYMPTALTLKIIQQFAGAFYVERKLSISGKSFILN